MKQLDKIYIEKLAVTTTIGVWEWEKRVRQKLVIDLELGCDISKATQSDDINDSVSYKEVALKIRHAISSSRFNLLETVAEKIAQILLSEFNVSWCKVKVSKPRAAEQARNVAVEIERTAL